ncbi:Hexokinase-3 [Platanthera zijinensis]|uniref:Phosphotransferase n=1 Tax=Platanthera zijinensis TaxID=2320716 RepID=A0AAP0BBA5_9ASPA
MGSKWEIKLSQLDVQTMQGVSQPRPEQESVLLHAQQQVALQGLTQLNIEFSLDAPFKPYDTVGSLALGHYHDNDTVVAVVIGTRTNVCFVELTEAIIKSQGLLTNSGGMVVNMELMREFLVISSAKNSYDIALDDESPNRN